MSRRAAPPPEPVLSEAWWGGNRAGGARPEPPHLVEWIPGQHEGRALCGRQLYSAPTYPIGAAARVRVKRCTACDRKLAARAPNAPVVPIGVGRAHRRRQEGRTGPPRGNPTSQPG